MTHPPRTPAAPCPPEPVSVAPGVHWIGALDPDLRSFDGLMRTPTGTTYNAYAVRGRDGVAVIDTVPAEFAPAFLARLEAVAGCEEVRCLVLNHLEPDHTGAVAALLRRAPQAEVILSPRGLPMLRALLGEDFGGARVRAVTTGDSVALGGATLRFLTTPDVHWPDTQCTWLEEARVLFSCDLFGSHHCAPALFDDLAGDFRLAFDSYFDNIMRPFRSAVGAALDLIEPLDIAVIAPAHGPILRSDPRAWLHHTRRRVAGPLAPAVGDARTLVILHASVHGATAALARAIGDGAGAQRGVAVALFDLAAVAQAPLLDLIEQADGLALGSPTVNGDAARPVWELLVALCGIETRGKLGAAFGSYGWSGEAVRVVEQRLQGLKMRVPEPGLRARLHPTAAELEAARAFGGRLAAHLTGRATPREIDFADLVAR